MTITPESEGESAPQTSASADAVDELFDEVEEAVGSPEAEAEMSPLDHPHRLLLVHAHPDDEVIATGGTMARYAAEHALVTLVTCTLGEEGEIVVPHLRHLASANRDELGEHRIGELAAACEALGVRDFRFLGGAGRWRDSGMMGEPTNERPDCFWQADLTEAARELVAIMRQIRPQVVITYDENGGYGHPDHIQAHNVAVAAFELCGDPSYEPDLGEPWQPAKLYYSVVARSQFREGMDMLAQRGIETGLGEDELSFVVDDDQVTTEISVADQLAAKVAAMRAHESQIAVDDFFYALADGGGRAFFARECYQLVRGDLGLTDERGKEDDLFAGVHD